MKRVKSELHATIRDAVSGHRVWDRGLLTVLERVCIWEGDMFVYVYLTIYRRTSLFGESSVGRYGQRLSPGTRHTPGKGQRKVRQQWRKGKPMF